ncbi:hypothetical protein M422DRAFT_50354 [Sphaerobolus stellatus SS14]|uniref:Uncharacterized protein n=1 Tax=Sphaerobolus stellatus (strain SS14) TaxID=990650 RepID=A0A0C9U3T4_SPHS4|nr:hypothetical protein M422DRAFT_50354 [Sphaerobolus stellatus SS14]
MVYSYSYSLPLPLIALSLSFLSLHISSTSAQSTQQITLNSILPLTLSSTNPTISIPLPSSNALNISVSLCSLPATNTDTNGGNGLPTFTVKNGRLSNGTIGAWTIKLEGGIGIWSGGTDGGSATLSLDGGGGAEEWDVEVGVSDSAPLHALSPSLPLLSDTSSTLAILFSAPFAKDDHKSPSFPNYTLPSGNITSFPNPPSGADKQAFTMVFIPTGTTDTDVRIGGALARSACAIRRAGNNTAGAFLGTSVATGTAAAVDNENTGSSGNGNGNGINANQSLILRSFNEGWRTQWLIEGLTPSTNYTAWVLSGGVVSGPVFGVTKSDNFACTLAHSLPFCPQTSYAIPLPPPSDGSATYTPSNLPSSVTGTLISSISNFTTLLLTFPCGRDVYSFKQTCEDCQEAYRTWACAVSLPRCAEEIALPSPPPTSTAKSKASQTPIKPALLAHPEFPTRTNLSLTAPSSSSPAPAISQYTELLPCIETCNAVDRAAPPMFGWKCPGVDVNANETYGVGFIDSWDGTVEGGGTPGVSVDRWGVAWCNG